jgi:hypothetical protein
MGQLLHKFPGETAILGQICTKTANFTPDLGPAGHNGKTQVIAKLDQDTRCTLRKAFQNAFAMQNEICSDVGALAKKLDCTIECAEDAICSIAIMADTGMEVGELELRELLGEPGIWTQVGRPVKPMVLN